MARASEKLVGPICPRMPRSIIPVSAVSPRSVTGAFPASQRATEPTPSNCEECDTDDQDECRQPVTYDYRIDECSEADPHVDIIADHRSWQGILARVTEPLSVGREQGASDIAAVDR